jgi:hypothetical protein
MNIIYLALLWFGLFQSTIMCTSSSQMKCNHNFRNLGLKFIIFKKKKYPMLIDYINTKNQIYYEKLVAFISERVSEYENLAYEDKIMIDFILSINNFV